MERPGIVWVFTILIVLGIILDLFGALSFFSGLVGTMETIPILMAVLGLLLIIPRGIMVAKFFKLQKDALLWVHISFGLVLFLGLIETIIYFATLGPLGGLVAAPSLIIMGLYILFWWAIVDYINKKQIDGQPVFT